MSPRDIALAVLCVWLLGSLALILGSIRAGRRLAEALAARHPRAYEELGRPWPTLYDSARGLRFTRFLLRREYVALQDVVLVPQLEEHRAQEVRRLILIAAGGLFVLAVGLWERHAG